MGGRRLGAWGAALLLAVAFELLGNSGGSGVAVADFAVGMAFLAGGLLVWDLDGRRAIALLFLATGVAWFLGTLAGSDVGTLSTIGSAMLYLHRGPFVHLVLAYPTGGLRSRLDRVVVGAAYVDGVLVWVAQSDAATVALVTMVIAAGALGVRGRSAGRRQARGLATGCFAFVGGTLVLVVVDGLLQAPRLSDTTLLLVYEASLLASAIALTLWLLVERSEPATVADLVVELGARPRSGVLGGALGRAVGDPSLEIGYPVGGSYVDERGEPMTLPLSGDRKTVTVVTAENGPLAVLVHDAAVADDPALASAVNLAARLTAANTRLHAELRGQVRELAASRRRIVEAGDVQRSRLERRLDEAVESHLNDMRLAVARATEAAPPKVAKTLGLLTQELDAAVRELRELARGIHPHTLTESGLATALFELAATAPIRVSLSVPSDRYSAGIEIAAYFVCAEALANVAKHAQTETARVEVRREDGRLAVRVADDGVGGADARGSGLRGLADRLEAADGRLLVSSSATGGTSILAEFPLEGDR